MHLCKRDDEPPRISRGSIVGVDGPTKSPTTRGRSTNENGSRWPCRLSDPRPGKETARAPALASDRWPPWPTFSQRAVREWIGAGVDEGPKKAPLRGRRRGCGQAGSAGLGGDNVLLSRRDVSGRGKTLWRRFCVGVDRLSSEAAAREKRQGGKKRRGRGLRQAPLIKGAGGRHIIERKLRTPLRGMRGSGAGGGEQSGIRHGRHPERERAA